MNTNCALIAEEYGIWGIKEYGISFEDAKQTSAPLSGNWRITTNEEADRLYGQDANIWPDVWYDRNGQARHKR